VSVRGDFEDDFRNVPLCVGGAHFVAIWTARTIWRMEEEKPCLHVGRVVCLVVIGHECSKLSLAGTSSCGPI